MTRAAPRPTVFLDRDGTLNREVGFVTDPDRLELLPGVPAAVHRLADAGYRLVVVTNQSGIARGLYDERTLAAIHERLATLLDHRIEAFLHCPHHPDGGHGYGGACECRKPAPGLLHQARDLLGCEFQGGWLIGDSARDVLMARGLPLRTVLVRCGKPVDNELQKLRAAACTPDHVVEDLLAAAAIVTPAIAI
ncbi:MAG: HAD-IIIA family hydrolase [Planctomycetes bacterium]|nr:HAD-IIIA family hydrolase [Planctomycetota bacterium]MCC7396060.1 HAD-IIIA family hydrolase [Planctomycetota bacterium]